MAFSREWSRGVIGIGVVLGALVILAIRGRKVQPKLRVDWQNDKMRFVFVIYNGTSEPVTMASYRFTINGRTRDWQSMSGFVIPIEPRSTEEFAWGYVYPSNYNLVEGSNTASYELMDTEERTYQSDSIEFEV